MILFVHIENVESHKSFAPPHTVPDLQQQQYLSPPAHLEVQISKIARVLSQAADSSAPPAAARHLGPEYKTGGDRPQCLVLMRREKSFQIFAQNLRRSVTTTVVCWGRWRTTPTGNGNGSGGSGDSGDSGEDDAVVIVPNLWRCCCMGAIRQPHLSGVLLPRFPTFGVFVFCRESFSYRVVQDCRYFSFV